MVGGSGSHQTLMVERLLLAETKISLPITTILADVSVIQGAEFRAGYPEPTRLSHIMTVPAFYFRLK
jgi:hypothetical protein